MISVIIPYCDAFNGKAMKERNENLLFGVKNFYLKHKGIEIIVVCQNSYIEVPGASIIRIYSSVFNKGWCINVGMKVANNQTICIAESDMFAKQPYLLDVETHMKKNNLKWCFCWNKLWYTSERYRRTLITGKSFGIEGSISVPPKQGASEGGLVIFDREFFKSIGGCNEWFQELGGPDNELARRAEAETGTYQAYPQEVFHLWHPKCRSKDRPSRISNINLYKSTARQPKEFNNFLSKEHFGNPYEPLCDKRTFKRAWIERG